MVMKKVLVFLLAILMIVPLASCNKTEELLPSRPLPNRLNP